MPRRVFLRLGTPPAIGVVFHGEWHLVRAISHCGTACAQRRTQLTGADSRRSWWRHLPAHGRGAKKARSDGAERFELHNPNQPDLGVVLAARAVGEFGDDKKRFTDVRARKNTPGRARSPGPRGRARKPLSWRTTRQRRLGIAGRLQAFSALWYDRVAERRHLLEEHRPAHHAAPGQGQSPRSRAPCRWSVRSGGATCNGCRATRLPRCCRPQAPC